MLGSSILCLKGMRILIFQLDDFYFNMRFQTWYNRVWGAVYQNVFGETLRSNNIGNYSCFSGLC